MIRALPLCPQLNPDIEGGVSRQIAGENLQDYKERVETFPQFRQLRNKYLRLEKERVRQLRRRNPEEMIKVPRPRKLGKNQYKSDGEVRQLLLEKLARKRAKLDAQVTDFTLL